MTNEGSNQALSADDLEELERELKRRELDKLMLEKNIDLKRELGYFDAVERNAAIDRWRRSEADAYSAQRRKGREREAAKEGRTLRPPYLPATPERRQEQLRASKAKARLDPEYAAAERASNTAARQASRAAMTQEERDEANRIRREKRAAKKAATKAG